MQLLAIKKKSIELDTGEGSVLVGDVVALPLTCKWVIKSHQISIHYFGVPWEAVWGLPASGRRTTNPIGYATAEGVEGTTGATIGSLSAPVEQLHRGTQGPLNGLKCARVPERRISRIDGSPFPEDSTYGTAPTSIGGAHTPSSRPMPSIFSVGGSVRICPLSPRLQWLTQSPICSCSPTFPPGWY